MALELASRTMNGSVGSPEDKRVLIKPGKDTNEDDENSLCECLSKVTLLEESKDSHAFKIKVLPMNDVNKETKQDVLSFKMILEVNKMESILTELSNDFVTKTNIHSVDEQNDEITEETNKSSITVPREFDEDEESGASDDELQGRGNEESGASDDELQGRGPYSGIAVKEIPNLDPELVGDYLHQLSPNSLAQQGGCKVTEQQRRNYQFLAEQGGSSRKFRRPNDSEVQNAASGEAQQPSTMQSTLMQPLVYVHPSMTQGQQQPINVQYQLMQQGGAMQNDLNQPVVMQTRTTQPPATIEQQYYLPNSTQHYANPLLRNTPQQVLQSTAIQQRNPLPPATQQPYNLQSINSASQAPLSVTVQSQNVPPVATKQYYGGQPINIAQLAQQSTTLTSQNYLSAATQQPCNGRQLNMAFNSVALQSTPSKPQNNQPLFEQRLCALPPRSMQHISSNSTINQPAFIQLMTTQIDFPQPYIPNEPNHQYIFPQLQNSCTNSQKSSGSDCVTSQAIQNVASQENHCTASENATYFKTDESFASLPSIFDESFLDEYMRRTTDDDLNTIDLESFNSLIEKLEQNDLPEVFVPQEVPRLEANNPPQESKQISNIDCHASAQPIVLCSDLLTLPYSPHSTTGHSPHSSNAPSPYSEHELNMAYLSPSSVSSDRSRDIGYQEENNATDVTNNATPFNSTIPISVEEIPFDFDNPATEGMYDDCGRLIVPKPSPRRGGGRSRAVKNKKQANAPFNEKQASVACNGMPVLTNNISATSNPFMTKNMNVVTGNDKLKNGLPISAIRIPFVPDEQARMMMTNFNFNQQQQQSGPSQHQLGSGDNQRKKLQPIKPRPVVPPTGQQQAARVVLQSIPSLPQQQQPDVRIYRQLAGMTTEKLIRADQDGDTILHIAISRGENKLVEALLDRLERAGLLVKIMQTVNHHHQTPLFLAVMMNNDSITRQLIERGADVNEVLRKMNTSESGLSHFRLLHYAAAKGSSFVSTLRELLKAPGVDVNARNSQGLSPLHISINSHGNRISSVNDGIIDSMPAIFLLAEHGANLNVPDGLNGMTPLHYIIEKKNAKLTNWFLELITHINPMQVPGRITEGVLGGVPGDVTGSGIDILCSILTTRTKGGLTPVQLAKVQQSTSAECDNVVQILLAAEARVEKLKSCRVNAMNSDCREGAVRIC